MKSFRDRNPYMIGIASVLAIGLIVGGAFSIGLFKVLEHTYGMSGVFSDAAGIRNGDPVRVAGVKVGYVTGVKANHTEGNVIVTWKVNQGIHLGPSTEAEVALGTLLGAKYLRLSGPVAQPYMESLPEDKRRIAIDKTHTPFDVFELVKVSTESINQTDSTKLNELITQLADITQGKHDQIAQLLTGISELSAALNQRDSTIRQLLDRADTLSGNLAAKDSTLVTLIDQSRGILALIKQRRDDIARALESGDSAVGELANLLTRNKTYLDGILTTLHPALDVIAANQTNIDQTLSLIGPGAFGLALAPSHGPWQDVYIRDIGPSVVCLLSTALNVVNPSCP